MAFGGAALAQPLSLADIVARARAGDLRVKEAEGQVRILRGKFDEARWAWFPKIEANVYLAGPTPEALNDGLGGAPTSKATLMYDTNFGNPGVMVGAEAQGVLPLYTFGKLSALERLGKKGVEVGEALRTRAQDEAEFQAVQAFWGYQLARQGEAALRDTAKRLDDAAAILQRLRVEGSAQVTEMDVFKMAFFKRQVDARSGAVTSGKALALGAVRLLLNLGPHAPVELVPSDLSAREAAPIPLADCMKAAKEFRPELKAVAAGVEAREQEVLLKERMFFPDIGLAGFARWKWTTSATRQLSPFAYDPYNDLSAGVGLVTRYSFDIPQKLAQLEQARGELEKLKFQSDLLTAAVHLEIEKAHGEWTEAISRGAAQAAAEKEALRWATAAFTAFDLGTGDTRELVDAFTALATASTEKLRAWFDAELAMQAVSKAVGRSVRDLGP